MKVFHTSPYQMGRLPHMESNVIPGRLHPSDIVDLYKQDLFIHFHCQSLQEGLRRPFLLQVSRSLLNLELYPGTSNSRFCKLQRAFEAISAKLLHEKVNCSTS